MFNIPVIGTYLAKTALAFILSRRTSLKAKIITYVNAKVDIPRLTEVEEEKLFQAVMDAIEAALTE
jgi:hypothetical protein